MDNKIPIKIALDFIFFFFYFIFFVKISSIILSSNQNILKALVMLFLGKTLLINLLKSPLFDHRIRLQKLSGLNQNYFEKLY